MLESEKDFLILLGYFYLQNRKHEKALILFRFLHTQFPEDKYVTKSLSYTCILTGAYENGLRLANRLIRDASDMNEETLGQLLRSKSLWGLGRKDESRLALSHFFRLRGNS
jgi:hypothetical protein